MIAAMAPGFVRLPELLAAHVAISVAAIALALAVSLPLGLVAARCPRIGNVLLGFASLVQTIPALALLALFYPVLLLLSSLVGGAIPAFGFLPAWLALALYALLPILRNLVTGLAGIDPAVIEAADGVGMTPGQKLRLVEAPLALPVLMAGIRTASVWTIGAATLATTVGQPSLGDLIFAGLQTQNWGLVLVGCIASAGLALVADGLLVTVETGLRKRKSLRIWIAAALLALGIGAALIPTGGATGAPVVTIGAKNFSEQYILARLLGNRLTAAGYDVRYREGLGSSVLFGALAHDDVDIYVDYVGTVWTNEMKRTDTPPRAAMIAATADWAIGQRGVTLVGPLGFENAYAFAMRAADAKRLNLHTLDDLAARSPSLRLGSDLEFLDRPEWAAIKAAYPMRFAEARPFQPSFMYRALQSGRVDAITAFSSDGRIAAYDFVTLSDPKGAVPAYDAILLAGPRASRDPRIIAALRPIIGRIDVDLMRRANYLVDRDEQKQSPDQAAAWLEKGIDKK